MTVRTDPITNEVVRHAYNAIADDVSALLARSAYSPAIYEAHDYGIGIFDRRARLLGQYAGLPLFTGGLDAGLRAIIERYGLDDMHAGDVFTVNDSYITGGHLNDVDVIGVVADGDEVIGFVAIRAHWADVGSAEPGFPVNSRNIFQEGVRWGPTRIVQQGAWLRDIVDLLCLNSRLPHILMGDLKAQIAAIRLGNERLCSLKRRFGQDLLEACATQIFDVTEGKYRAFIASIPDGVYRAEGVSDDDGTTDEPVLSRVSVTIDGDRMIIDTAGSSEQRPGNLNTAYPNTLSAARLALALLFPAGEPDVNDGSFRALEVRAEPGSIYAAHAPAPCMRPHPVMLLIDLIIKALSDVLPEHVAAGLPGDSWNVFLMGTSSDGKAFMSGEALDGGWGASAQGDGPGAVIHSAAGDFRNMPIEALEYRIPVRVNRMELGPDSGGAGRFRGGQNVVKEYQALTDMAVTLHFDRAKTPQWGLFGGAAGAAPKVTVYGSGNPDGFVVRKVEQLKLLAGERFVAETGGGGGYGLLAERAPEHITADIADRVVSGGV